MKTPLNETIMRIKEVMGLPNSLLSENPIPRPLIKGILKNMDMADDPTRILTKLFNLTDDQVDNVLRQVDDVGIDNLSDDLLELLSKQSLDNVDDVVKLLKSGKLLGLEFDNLASKIIEHVDSFDEITPKLKNGAYKLYRTTLDEIPYLKGSDNIKDKLMRDFQSEFDEKFADKMVRLVSSALDNELDNLFKESDQIYNAVNDVVEGMPANIPGREQIAAKWYQIFNSKETVYDQIRRRASYIDIKAYERAGSIKGMKDYEIEKLLGVSGDVNKVPKDAELVKAVSAAQNANYFTAVGTKFMQLPSIVRKAFWIVIFTKGTAMTFGSTLMGLLSGVITLGQQQLDKIKIPTGDVISLNKDNIINHLSTKLGVPIETIEGWVILISQDKKTATVEDPAVNGKIYQIKLNEVEDEPESNTITSTEA